MATTRLQVHLKPSDDLTNGWAEIQRFPGNGERHQFSTLTLRVGKTAMEIFLSDDDGREAERIANRLARKLVEVSERSQNARAEYQDANH